jgi:hypothetical protein
MPARAAGDDARGLPARGLGAVAALVLLDASGVSHVGAAGS